MHHVNLETTFGSKLCKHCFPSVIYTIIQGKKVNLAKMFGYSQGSHKLTALTARRCFPIPRCLPIQKRWRRPNHSLFYERDLSLLPQTSNVNMIDGYFLEGLFVFNECKFEMFEKYIAPHRCQRGTGQGRNFNLVQIKQWKTRHVSVCLQASPRFAGRD
jgi:hypothetical protein